MPFIQLLEPGLHMGLHVVTLDYSSLQSAPCQGQKTQDKFQSLSFLSRHLGDATTLHRPQPQETSKKICFCYRSRGQAALVEQQHCTVMEGASLLPSWHPGSLCGKDNLVDTSRHHALEWLEHFHGKQILDPSQLKFISCGTETAQAAN